MYKEDIHGMYGIIYRGSWPIRMHQFYMQFYKGEDERDGERLLGQWPNDSFDPIVIS